MSEIAGVDWVWMQMDGVAGDCCPWHGRMLAAVTSSLWGEDVADVCEQYVSTGRSHCLAASRRGLSAGRMHFLLNRCTKLEPLCSCAAKAPLMIVYADDKRSLAGACISRALDSGSISSSMPFAGFQLVPGKRNTGSTAALTLRDTPRMSPLSFPSPSPTRAIAGVRVINTSTLRNAHLIIFLSFLYSSSFATCYTTTSSCCFCAFLPPALAL